LSIFVTVGTTDFDGLVKAMDKLSTSLDEPVTIQIGTGRYLPKWTRYFRFTDSLEPYLRGAGLVVAHGGLATCTEVLVQGKPLVAVANPDRYDDHQQDLLARLEAEGFLLYCRDLDGLGKAIKSSTGRCFRPYTRPQTSIHLRIREYLSALEGT